MRIGIITYIIGKASNQKKEATQHPPSISLVSLRLVWPSFEATIRIGQSFSLKLSFWLMVGDKSQPFWCFRPPRSLSSSLRKFSELLKRCRGFLGSLAPRLRQEDEDEETSGQRDTAVEIEGSSMAKGVLHVNDCQNFSISIFSLQLPEGL